MIATCRRGCSISNRRRHSGSRARTHAVRKSDRPLNQPLYDIAIERISHDGRGIGQWQGKTLFVEGALPGERVNALLLRNQARFGEALADSILVPASERTRPPCAHYTECGGCQLQHMTPEHQLTIKQTALLEQLERWAGLTPERLLPPVVSPSVGYRSRARLGVWYTSDGKVTLGFRRRRSRELTPIDNCLVLEPVLAPVLQSLTVWLDGVSVGAITHVELIAASEGAAVLLRQVRPLDERSRQSLQSLSRERGWRIWLQGSSGQPLTELTGEPCDPRLSYDLDAFDLELVFHPSDFTQVNQGVNRAMVVQALEQLQLKRDDRVLDLFCGIGNFTLPLARHCQEVTGVEAVESMVERGRENADRQGLGNTRFIAADLSLLSGHELKRRCGKISALLLDPPREGARELLGTLGQLAPEKLVYVSCNPATLARDAGTLAEGGYRLQSLGVLDMFPHTAHVESMALFVRR